MDTAIVDIAIVDTKMMAIDGRLPTWWLPI
jgi:hypothetical protein